MQPNDVEEAAPHRLGSFELLGRIGRGRLCSVFRGRHAELDRAVAVKILLPRWAREPELVERFLREARAAGRLNHPNIASVVDVGESQGCYYLAAQFIEGETLRETLARHGPLREERALEVAADVARALDHAHRQGMVHGDIKPENILLTRDGRVVVTDFGLAKATGQDAQAGRFVGTPGYLAPERARFEPGLDSRADVFSLGVTLFEMLTGRQAFEGANPVALAAAALTQPLPSLRQLCPDAGAATRRLIEKMTAKAPDERYASPAELVAALDAAAAAPRGSVPALPAEPRRARRRRSSAAGLYAAIAAGVVGLLVVVLLVAASREDEPRKRSRRTSKTRDAETEARPGSAAQTQGDDPAHTAPPDEGKTGVPPAQLVAGLRRDLDKADAFARAEPTSYVSQIESYETIRTKLLDAGGSAVSPAARQLLEQVGQRLRARRETVAGAAEAALAQAKARAETLFAEHKRTEAVAVFDDFNTELRIPAIQGQLERLRAHYRRRAMDELDAASKAADALAAKGELDKAKALLTALKANNVPEVLAEADKAIARIDQLAATRAAAARNEAVRLYPKLAATVLDRLAERRYDEATGLIAAALADRDLAAVHGRIAGLKHLARAAAGLWPAVREAAKALKPGQQVVAAGVRGTLIGLEGSQLKLRTGGATMAVDLGKLTTREAVTLVVKHVGPLSKELEVDIALFLLAEREHAPARHRLDVAAKRGADVKAARDLLARLSPRPCARCAGNKAIPCPHCGGQGYTDVKKQPCPVCNGRGTWQCRKCNGRGWLRCARCGGRGTIARGAFRCPECGGDGRVDCPSCRRGQVTCKKCRGTGSVTSGTPCSVCKTKKVVPCPVCKGKGRLPPPELVPPS